MKMEMTNQGATLLVLFTLNGLCVFHPGQARLGQSSLVQGL